MADTIDRYDSPNFTILREDRTNKVAGPASATPFAYFRSRNKCIVKAVSIRVASAASAAGGSIHVCRLRNGPSNTSVQTIFTNTMVSANSAGTMWTCTLASSNTLATIHDSICLVTTGACDKGKFDVIVEYQLLPPLTVSMV